MALAFFAGEKGVGKAKKPLHFKGSTFHRVIPNFMVTSCGLTSVVILEEERCGQPHMPVPFTFKHNRFFSIF